MDARLPHRARADRDAHRQGAERACPALRPLQLARSLLRSNTRPRGRRDIAAHCDLGNELFEAALDPTMVYSWAIFERPEMTLEQASKAELERICRVLGLEERHRALEIGTGWGGFAVHAARTRS